MSENDHRNRFAAQIEELKEFDRKMSEKEPLHRAVCYWLRCMGLEGGSGDTILKGIADGSYDWGIEPDGIDDPMEATEENILFLLGECSPFGRDFTCVNEAMLRELAMWIENRPDPLVSHEQTDLVDAIVKRLREPEQVFHFSVQLPIRSEFSLNYALGGASNLCFQSSEAEAGGYDTHFTGQVNDIVELGAISKAEHLIKQIVGAALSIGVAEMTQPIRRFEPIRINLKPTIYSNWTLDPETTILLRQVTIALPEDLSQLEAFLIEKDSGKALQRRLDSMRALINSPLDRAEELRNAASLLIDALAAREPGRAIMFSFVCLEAVLLEKTNSDSVQARLAEAIAYRLGRTADERKSLRRTVGNLYKTRSDFVHKGSIDIDKKEQRESATSLARKILSREIEDLLGMESI